MSVPAPKGFAQNVDWSRHVVYPKTAELETRQASEARQSLGTEGYDDQRADDAQAEDVHGDDSPRARDDVDRSSSLIVSDSGVLSLPRSSQDPVTGSYAKGSHVIAHVTPSSLASYITEIENTAPLWRMLVESDYKARLFYTVSMPQFVSEVSIDHVKCSLLGVPYQQCQLLILNQLNPYDDEFEINAIPGFIANTLREQDNSNTKYLDPYVRRGLRNSDAKLPRMEDYEHRYDGESGKIEYLGQVYRDRDRQEESKNESKEEVEEGSRIHVRHGLDGRFDWSMQTWTFVFDFDFYPTNGIYHTLFHGSNGKFNYDTNGTTTGEQYRKKHGRRRRKNGRKKEKSKCQTEFVFGLYLNQLSNLSFQNIARIYNSNDSRFRAMNSFSQSWMPHEYHTMINRFHWAHYGMDEQNASPRRWLYFGYKRGNIFIGFNSLMTWYEQVRTYLSEYVYDMSLVECNSDWMNILFGYISFDNIQLNEDKKERDLGDASEASQGGGNRLSLHRYLQRPVNRHTHNVDLTRHGQEEAGVLVRRTVSVCRRAECSHYDTYILNKQHCNVINNAWVAMSTSTVKHLITFKGYSRTCQGHEQRTLHYGEYLSLSSRRGRRRRRRGHATADARQVATRAPTVSHCVLAPSADRQREETNMKTCLFGKYLFSAMSVSTARHDDKDNKDGNEEDNDDSNGRTDDDNVIMWMANRDDGCKLASERTRAYDVSDCIAKAKKDICGKGKPKPKPKPHYARW